METEIEITNMFLAAYVWQQGGVKPILRETRHDADKISFYFPEGEASREAMRMYDDKGLGNAHDFSERYKILRAELYLCKRGQEKTDA